MDIQFLILLALLIAVFAGLFFALRRHRRPEDQTLLTAVGELTRAFDTKIGEMTRTLQEQLNTRLREHNESFQNVHRQFQSFTREVTELRSVVKVVQDSVAEVAAFQDILAAPKLRGRWGELSLEHILAQYLPREAYELQHQFSSGEQVDVLLRLPNGKYLPIDAKFPLDDFMKMVEASGEAERAAYAKSFAAAVRKEIDDIAKKYIVPGEGTVDVAFMYVPAEAVFYEIQHRMPDEDLPAYARSRRVVVVSPNNFFLTIQMIQHWARDLQVGKQTTEILKRLGRIGTDAEKLASGFDRIGKHLRDASSAHADTQERLRLLVDRVSRVAELEGESRTAIGEGEARPRS